MDTDSGAAEYRRKWVTAANVLGADPGAEVLCPDCGVGHLMVKDELIDSWNKLDRYMVCEKCRRYNVLTMGVPDGYDRTSPVDTSKK